MYHITKDNINIHQTGNLIFALARNNPDFAEGVAGMVFHGVKQTEYYMNFFRLLTMLTELPGAGGPPGTEKKFNYYNFGLQFGLLQ